MTLHSIGDLALGLQTRLGNQRIRTEIASLTQELTTGIRRDIAAPSRGDMTTLATLDRSLAVLDAYKVAADEAALFTQTMQHALLTIQATGADLGPAMLEAGTTGHATLVDATARDAHARMETVIAALNTRSAGRAVFAGTGTDGPALASRDTIMADLRAATAGAADAAGVTAAVDAWFDAPGGGFETAAYRGATTALAPVRVGEGQSAEIALTAADPGLRDLLKGYALAALVAEGAVPGGHETRVDVLDAAARLILGGDATLAALGAGVGRAEARIADARAANAAEATATGIARAALVAADPFETATALREAEGQLEALYVVTARLARLSLTEFLR